MLEDLLCVLVHTLGCAVAQALQSGRLEEGRLADGDAILVH